MLHQLIATVCGITLQTQVNACRVTLQQATVNYNTKLEQKLNEYKKDLENTEFVSSLKNDYTLTAIALGKVVYDRQLVFNQDNFGLTLRKDRALCTWRWMF